MLRRDHTMSTLDPERVARLPKWARDHISQAGAHIVYLEVQRDALAGSPEGRIVVVGHALLNGLRPAVPDDLDAVTWRLQEPLDDHVVVRYSPASQSHDSLPGVTIQTGRRMVVHPHASNVISVRPETAEEWSDQRDRYREVTKGDKP
jgi:hypothetical protein